MNHLKKIFLLKILSFIVLGISIFAIFAGSFWGVYTWENEMEINEDNFLADNYRQSPKFEALVNTRIRQLKEYIELKDILETNGKLDLNKVVLSTDYYDEFFKKDYTIKELMSINDFYIEEVYPVNNTTLSELFKEKKEEINFYQYKYNNGYVQILPGYSSEIDFVVNFLDKGNYILTENKNTALSKVKEIWNLDNAEGELLDGKIIELYSLNEIAYRFTYYVSFYSFYEELFKPGETVFNYWIETPEVTLTNLLDGELESIKKSKGNYISYDSKDYQISTNMNRIDRGNIEEIRTLLNGEEDKGFHIAIEIIPINQVSISDEFVLDENAFNRGKTIINSMIIAVIIAVFLTILCTGYLLYAVGHKKGVEGISLNRFDHVYSEIAAAILMLLAGVVAIPLIIITESYGITVKYILAIVTITYLVEYILFMIGMGSLIRRIKAKTLWSNSVCGKFIGSIKRIINKIIEMCKEVFLQRSTTAKILILYVGWVFVIIFMIFIMVIPRNSFFVFLGFLLFLGGNLVMLYFLTKTTTDYQKIISGTQKIAAGDINHKISDEKMNLANKKLVGAINNITDGLAQAVDSSIKNERMKTDLITNVSHDIKTPLTSIINYVDLMKRENIENEKIKSYLEVLDIKSQRLKTLTEDLVEASKLSSGNMEFIIENINFVELVTQVNGEFLEKFEERDLTIIADLPGEAVLVKVDGRRLWRVLENLYNNTAKYSMKGTRVYIDLTLKEKKAVFSVKNISEKQLNIKADDLTERFIRGESSRTTEGSGLGLSIARSLTELMDGNFEIYLDGDLFRVTVSFDLA